MWCHVIKKESQTIWQLRQKCKSSSPTQISKTFFAQADHPSNYNSLYKPLFLFLASISLISQLSSSQNESNRPRASEWSSCRFLCSSTSINHLFKIFGKRLKVCYKNKDKLYVKGKWIKQSQQEFHGQSTSMSIILPKIYP